MSIALLAASAIAVQAQQFTLDCVGTMRSSTTYAAEAVHPAAMRVSIDLERMVWCFDACDSPDGIAEANPAQIVLQREGDDRVTIHDTVNRITGAYAGFIEIRSDDGTITIETEAKCALGDYQPIPEASF